MVLPSSPNPPRWALPLLVVALVAMVAIGVGVALTPSGGTVRALDGAWYRWMLAAETPWLVAFAHGFAFVGSAVITVPLRVGMAVWLGMRRQWRRFAFWTVAVVTAEATTTIAKMTYDRPRPPMALEATATMSFPSGHATVTAVVTLTVVLLFTAPGRARTLLLIAAGIFSAAMAWSRTYLRVHWLSDVLGGVLVGTVGTLVAVLVVHAIIRKLSSAPAS